MRLHSLLPVFFFPLTFALHVNITECGITGTSASLGSRSEDLGIQPRQPRQIHGFIQVRNVAGVMWGYLSDLNESGTFGLTMDMRHVMRVRFMYMSDSQLFTIENISHGRTYPFVAAIADDLTDYAHFGGSWQATRPGASPIGAASSLDYANKPIETSIFLFTPEISPFGSQGRLTVQYRNENGYVHSPRILYNPYGDMFMICTFHCESDPEAYIEMIWYIV